MRSAPASPTRWRAGATTPRRIARCCRKQHRQPAGRRPPLLGHLGGAEDVARDPALHGDGRGRRAWPRRWRSMPACSVRDVDVKRCRPSCARRAPTPATRPGPNADVPAHRAPRSQSPGGRIEHDDCTIAAAARPAARRHPRHRLHAGDDGPGLHADARRLRRRRDQDRARRRRRPEPLDLPAERRHRQPGLLQPEPQQAQRRARPAQRRADGGGEGADRRRRRGRQQLPRRRDGPHGPRLRRLPQAQPAHHLCGGHRLRRDRPVCAQGRAGRAGAGDERRDGAQGRSVAPAGHLPDRAGRLLGRHAHGAGHPAGAAAARAHRRRPEDQRVALQLDAGDADAGGRDDPDARRRGQLGRDAAVGRVRVRRPAAGDGRRVQGQPAARHLRRAGAARPVARRALRQPGRAVRATSPSCSASSASASRPTRASIGSSASKSRTCCARRCATCARCWSTRRRCTTR